MHGIISIEEQTRLQRTRDFYERRNTEAPGEIESKDCLKSIHFLLDVIDRLELSPFRNMVACQVGYVVYITGKYKHGSVKHTLIFAHFSKETDKAKVLQAVIDKNPALLLGFEILGTQLVPIENEKTFTLGTGI